MPVITWEDELHSFLRAGWLQASPLWAPVITHSTLPSPLLTPCLTLHPTVLATGSALLLPRRATSSPSSPSVSSDPPLSPTCATLRLPFPSTGSLFCPLSLLLELIAAHTRTHRRTLRDHSEDKYSALHNYSPPPFALFYILLCYEC